MTNNAASTHKRVGNAPSSVDDTSTCEDAARLVDRAEAIFELYLKPGRWPASRAAQRFLKSGDLERVLSLYTRAMEEAPGEPAYPWNLASSLDRLRLPDLALIYIRRAIRVAAENGEDEWAGADAHLAWADIAIRAGEPETAEVAIDQARKLDPHVSFERYLRRLRRGADGAAGDEPARHEDASRKGAAVEHLIAASCMLASDFELNVSTSLVDDEGVDLVFHRRQGSAMLGVQVKSRSWQASTMRTKARFITQVRRSTFDPREDLFLLFVAVDMRFADYGPLWLVPSLRFAEIAGSGDHPKLRFSAGASPASNDRWAPYRLERSELPVRIIAELAALEAAQPASRSRHTMA